MIDRIVVINDLSNPMGGASLLAVQSARDFAGRGYAVTFISGDTGPTKPENGVQYISLGQGRLLAGNVGAAMIRGIYNRQARTMISDWIAANDTPGTVYHIHGWSQILSPSLFSGLELVWDRVVMTSHDFFLTCPNGAFYDFQTQQPCPRQPMSSDCISANCDRRNYGHKLWRTARHAVQGQMFAESQAPPQLLIHHGMAPYFERSGLAKDRLVVLPNPITPYASTRIPAEINRSVLFVGRFETTKGVDLAAEACRIAGTTLIALGDGVLAEELAEKFPEMSFPGRVSPEAIGEYAKKCRMLVMPSRHMEPFGLTAVEALWSGLPVIASRVSLIANDIEECGAGFAIDASDVGQFAATIERLMNDDGMTAAMSNAAFHDTSHLALTPDRWIDALLASYAALISEGPGALAKAAPNWLARGETIKMPLTGAAI